MRRFRVLVLWALIDAPVWAETDTLLMPSIVSVFEGSQAPPALGISLKGFALPGANTFVFNGFDLRAMYSLRHQAWRADAVWPSIFGILYPGVSLDYRDDKLIPWFYAQVDFFVLPFFGLAMGGIEPRLVPSCFVGFRIGQSGIVGETAIQIIFPLLPAKE